MYGMVLTRKDNPHRRGSLGHVIMTMSFLTDTKYPWYTLLIVFWWLRTLTRNPIWVMRQTIWWSGLGWGEYGVGDGAVSDLQLPQYGRSAVWEKGKNRISLWKQAQGEFVRQRGQVLITVHAKMKWILPMCTNLASVAAIVVRCLNKSVRNGLWTVFDYQISRTAAPVIGNRVSKCVPCAHCILYTWSRTPYTYCTQQQTGGYVSIECALVQKCIEVYITSVPVGRHVSVECALIQKYNGQYISRWQIGSWICNRESAAWIVIGVLSSPQHGNCTALDPPGTHGALLLPI